MEPLDLTTGTWRLIKAECEKAIEEGRQITETPGIGERDADVARGQIAMAKRILRLSEPSKLTPQLVSVAED